jgi:(p)ppGpp synthase/HD superfamily hydrolase
MRVDLEQRGGVRWPVDWDAGGTIRVTLEDAIAIAARAHQGQRYPTTALGRDPFILHPLRVMLRLTDADERIVAVLHDVVEDTELTLDELRREGVAERLADAIDRLTRRDQETYDDYVLRVAGDALARAVKLADLEDNIEHNVGYDEASELIAASHRTSRARVQAR